MKKITFFTIFCVLSLTIPVFSAEPGPENAKPVSFEEKHKDAIVVFLLNEINIKVNNDWSYTTRIHKKAKVLKEEAKVLGDIPLCYEKGKDIIQSVRARSVTPDGKSHKPSKIQDFKTFEGYAMYSDAMTKVITLPEVNVGSIVEYEAAVMSKNRFLKNTFWYARAFDFSFPTKETNFTITVPKSLGIQYKEFNVDYKPTVTDDGSAVTYSWHIAEKEESSESESYLPPPRPDNIKNAVEFSSIKNWSDISVWYYSVTQKNLKVTPEIEEIAKSAAADYTSLKDKVRAVLEYMQDNFRYVSMSFGDNALEPHPTDQVFKNKYGDCKDLSLLCMAMLKAVGINSYIALFNNEFSISDPQYDLPIPSLFDHVLLLVDDPEGGNFYIDPLLKGYDIGQYPKSCQAAYTFIIDENGGRFDQFPIYDEKRCSTETKRDITINPDGSALIESQMTWELDNSIEERQNMKAKSEDEKKKFYESLDNMLASGGEIIERRADGMDDKYGALNTYLKMKRKEEYPVADNMIIIDLTGYGRDKAFTEKERKNHIFYPGNSIDETVTTYHIPAGFRISHVPEDLNLDIGFFNFKRKYVRKKDGITVTEIIRYKRLELQKESYKKVKDFYDQLPAKTNQRIILKKVKKWRGMEDWLRRLISKFRKTPQTNAPDKS